MENKELEAKLKAAMEQTTPDVLDRILAACEHEKGEVYIMEEMRKQKSNKWIAPLAGVAAGLAIAVAGYFGLATLQQSRTVDAIVGIDVNPSIELRLNSKEKVLETIAINEDAKAILAGMDLSGTNLDVAMNAIIGSMLQQGYIDELANSVLLTVESDNREKGDALRQRLTQEVEAMMQQNQIQASILSQIVRKDDPVQQLADQHGLSMGRAKLVHEVAQNNPLLKEEELVKLTVNELNLLLGAQPAANQQMNTTGQASSKAYIGEQKAMELALKAAGITANQVVWSYSKMDWDDGRMVYEVDLRTDTMEYEVDVDATTGSTVKLDKEKLFNPASSSGNSNNSNNGNNGNNGNANAPKDVIGVPKARALALAHAGVSQQAATMLKSQLDRDDGRYNYDVTFRANGYEYDYEIDALTGEILKSEKEVDDDYRAPGTGSSASTANRITKNDALTKALAHAGVSKQAATQLKNQLDRDDGRERYEIEFNANGYEYDYEVDAVTGEILKSEKDVDDYYRSSKPNGNNGNGNSNGNRYDDDDYDDHDDDYDDRDDDDDDYDD